MLQAVGDVREGFICPQCHQDMSTMEMLQVHFQDIHMKQSPSTVKGLFSFAKQKIKSVQDNFTNIPNEQTNNYAQYFSSDQNDSSSKPQQIGYIRSYTDRFKKERKAQHDQISIETTRLLLRIEKLISTGENIPKNANTKERRKYEQDIVEWIDDTKVTLCPSCAKSFSLSRRKHHCRLDGFVICDPCSRFLLFSKARYLIEPSTSSSLPNGLSLQHSNSLTSLNSTTADDSSCKDRTNNEDYLRICLSCQKVLQRRYDQICFKNTQRDEVFVCYEKIVEAKKILDEIHPTYSTMIESLLIGDTKYQIVDAQKLYRQLSTCYDKIDSTSKYISKLADSCLNIDEDDTQSIIRYSALCRNMRMYAIHVLQNFAISTRRVPSEDDVKRAREERKRLIEERIESERAAKAELASRIPLTDSPAVKKKEVSGWRPTIDRNLLVQAQELNPLVQQVYQVTEYIRQAQIAGRLDEVESLKLNLKELEQALNNAQQQENVSTFDS
ncbi:unnamed protein product [Rotaria magnacalcarata]|uniref:Rabenosyn-5 n=1 Tax=Rotaria magnacalcarata TaxID=392030 RepID=A0A816Y225_9BILA|nr:unnamed protein product [Rotaria magnacalcarata]CAF1531036.1 unnamed protein product [Rotaria magnacalcarata]CAF2151706.1 unnamed protein product [Rotaria magnacalcarata]CAF3882539.1 unnamed protein product [Rotaria magnacalcarata]CAF3958523.1 unnamed protein product [Rotaria magnacalcarata]